VGWGSRGWERQKLKINKILIVSEPFKYLTNTGNGKENHPM
jgi:hypothetical protein